MKKNWNFSMAQFLWYDCTFKNQCTVPVTLTFDLWRSNFCQWIEYNPIIILYKFQIDLSSNSWEIKYQNIGRTHTHTHTHTDRHTDRQADRVKTIPRNPLRGRGNKPFRIVLETKNIKWPPSILHGIFAIPWLLYQLGAQTLNMDILML